MTLPTIIRRIRDDYPRLHDLLPADTAPREDNMGRSGTKVHAPLVIRVEVSDTLRRIEVRALDWEAEVRRALGYGAPYWTKPKPAAVPESLAWTARSLDDPELTLPEDVAAWVAATASGLDRTCRFLLNPPAVDRSGRGCPDCGKPTLFRSGDVTRCIATGCEYRVVAA